MIETIKSSIFEIENQKLKAFAFFDELQKAIKDEIADLKNPLKFYVSQDYTVNKLKNFNLFVRLYLPVAPSPVNHAHKDIRLESCGFAVEYNLDMQYCSTPRIIAGVYSCKGTAKKDKLQEKVEMDTPLTLATETELNTHIWPKAYIYNLNTEDSTFDNSQKITDNNLKSIIKQIKNTIKKIKEDPVLAKAMNKIFTDQKVN